MSSIERFVIAVLSLTGGAVAVVWAIALAAGYVRRLAAKSPLPGQLSAEELDAMQSRLAELEQRVARVEEIEERLDFMERALALRNPSEK